MDPRLAIHQPTDDKGMFQMYQNTAYMGKRVERQSLIVHINAKMFSSLTAESGRFDLTLEEDFNIGRTSDVYLDNMTSIHLKSPYETGLGSQLTQRRMAMLLHIDQFKSKMVATDTTSSNSGVDAIYQTRSMSGGIVVTNESRTTDASALGDVVVHRARKNNYICTMNPKKLKRISGTISPLIKDDASASTLDDLFKQADNDTTTSLFFEFVFVERDE